MADVRCPMCGQPNPDHLEECQFCQARLKPLVGGAPGQDSPQDDDWLRSLRGEEDGDELPDWLEDFDDELIPAEDEVPEPDSGPEKQEPDPEPAGSPADEPENPIPDWLTSLGPVEDFSAADPDLPAWLTQLADPGEELENDRAEDSTVPPVPPVEPDVPEEAQPPEEDDSFSFLVDEDGLPDWLAAVGAPWRETEPAGETLPAMAEDEPVDEPAPDTEDGFDAPLEEEAPDLYAAEQDEPVPDWLAALESEDEEPGGEESPALPDWLARLAEEEEEEEDRELLPFEEPPDVSAVPEETETLSPAESPADPDLPPWLSEFEEMIGGKDDSRDVEEKPVEKDDDDWLAGFVDEPERALEEESGDPDWLSGFISEGAEPEREPDQGDVEADESSPDLPAEEPAETIADDAVPDWLMTALEQGEKEDEAPVEEGVEEEGAPADAFSAPLPGAEEDLEPELEAWLSSFSIEEEQEPEAVEAESPNWLVEADAPLSVESSAGEEVPGWLQDLQDRSLSEDLTDSEEWRADAGLEEVEEPDSEELQPSEEALTLAALTGGETIEDDLSPGDLPDWLKAMEPAETLPPVEDEAIPAETGSIERVGPLAGMRGLLSAEPVAAQAGRPPAQFVRLQISDLQQRRADQLQKMVQAETAPRTPDRETGLTEQKVLRYLIAVALFLVALVPTMLPGRLSALPPRPAEMERLNALIMGLTSDSTVLVATDYQPGMSGEMDAASAAVLDHLMIQRAKLALVSTQATGPALGERLVRSVSLAHNYAYGTEYVNLGYLAGDSTGLRSFAAAPQETLVVGYDSLPLWGFLDLARSNPWSQPALQGVTGLADFDLTVVISDDPDGIRRWIEQVSPALRPNSLVVIASAQAAPMVRPYMDGPVAALVSGVPGGAAYEGFLQREGPARAAWDAFGLGSLIVVVLVLGAGSYNLYLAWRLREKARKGRS